ncbi:MAG: hypothetical protein H6730_35450 [Deltaproteobacteria bacterium]|nr:hypothetical protein [Deltaproteobacteria bacterium]
MKPTRILPAAVVLVACGGQPDEHLDRHETGPVASSSTEAPRYVIELPGEEVRFLVDEYGSVGVLGVSRTGVSVLDEPELDEASPAVVFHALSREPIPEALLRLHEDLVGRGRVPRLEEAIAGRVAGWARPTARALSQPCRNSTFTELHCAHPDYDSSVCWLNISGARETWVPYAHRFKAGYCLQDGQNWGHLYYKNVLNCGNHANFADHYIWGEGHPIYDATTYFTYVWWRPSDAPLRAFHHMSTFGGTRDFASRYSQSPCDG